MNIEIPRDALVRVVGAGMVTDAMTGAGRIYSGALGEDWDSAGCIARSKTVGGIARASTMATLAIGGTVLGALRAKPGQRLAGLAMGIGGGAAAGNLLEDLASTKTITMYARECEKK